MYYAKSHLGALEQTTILAQDPDPRRPFPTTQPRDFWTAMPLFGPWYGASPHLGPESYYNPRTYPYAAVNPFLPRWSGNFIQPGNIDPLVVNGGLPAMEDPTGGAYWESVGPLGPGESIGVASQWAGDVKPRGFATTTV